MWLFIKLLTLMIDCFIVKHIIDRWRDVMETVTLSPKYQVVIPRSIRKQLGIKPGEKIRVVLFENRLELIPVKSMKKTRGILKGMDVAIKRERDRL